MSSPAPAPRAPFTDGAPTPPSGTLTAKQVRELRRLCRKTANRAQYDDRSVQVRQIASILAMAGPALADLTPSSTTSQLQAWVDAARAAGADWRDERILLPAAAAELRAWDRLLKAWADAREDAPVAPATPARKAPLPASPALGTPITPAGGEEGVSAPRPRLVPVGAGSAFGPAVHFADDGASEDGGSEVSAEGEEEAEARRQPLRALSISRHGNVIDVSLPPRGGAGRTGAKAGRTGGGDENAEPVGRNSSGRDLGALAKSVAALKVGKGPAVAAEGGVSGARDWSALRGSGEGQ